MAPANTTPTTFRVLLDELEIRAAKRRLAAALPGVGSVHLTEALAAALGFPSHRVLLNEARRADGGSAPFDTARFRARLAELGYATADRDYAATASLAAPAVVPPGTACAVVPADWPGRVKPFGIHLIAGGPCDAAEGVSAAVAALSRTWSNGNAHVLRYGRTETSLTQHRMVKGSAAASETLWSHPTGGAEARDHAHMAFRGWPFLEIDVVAFDDLTFDDLAYGRHALMALQMAMNSFPVVAGIAAGTAREAVARLAGLGIARHKLVDSELLHRIDVLATTGPRPLLSESWYTTRDLLAGFLDGGSGPRRAGAATTPNAEADLSTAARVSAVVFCADLAEAADVTAGTPLHHLPLGGVSFRAMYVRLSEGATEVVQSLVRCGPMSILLHMSDAALPPHLSRAVYRAVAGGGAVLVVGDDGRVRAALEAFMDADPAARKYCPLMKAEEVRRVGVRSGFTACEGSLPEGLPEYTPPPTE